MTISLLNHMKYAPFLFVIISNFHMHGLIKVGKKFLCVLIQYNTLCLTLHVKTKQTKNTCTSISPILSVTRLEIDHL